MTNERVGFPSKCSNFSVKEVAFLYNIASNGTFFTFQHQNSSKNKRKYDRTPFSYSLLYNFMFITNWNVQKNATLTQTKSSFRQNINRNQSSVYCFQLFTTISSEFKKLQHQTAIGSISASPKWQSWCIYAQLQWLVITMNYPWNIYYIAVLVPHFCSNICPENSQSAKKTPFASKNHITTVVCTLCYNIMSITN